ncbi:MAG: type III pantothenate kinase [Candidatus Omnitrophota bacterium]|nr:MAG: type III pantothenate kinase [Candidatus Omnitrophota bacterium]
MIVVDIGNSSIHWAKLAKGKIKRVCRLDTKGVRLNLLKKVFGPYSKEKMIISSVVPSVTKIFKKLKNKTYVVGKDLKTPIQCRYDKKHVGMDRLVNAYASRCLYPGTRLIIDFGTAVTIDFLSKKGAYEGGLILPGLGSSLRVLSSCALLPSTITLKHTKKVIPKNTAQSINKGIEEGFSAMINTLVKKYQKALGLSPKERIIITGGEASFILPCLSFPYIYEPFLIFKGLVALGKTLKD